MLKTSLPDFITLPNGAELFPVIGGHLRQKPFLTVNNSGVDVNTNGWASELGLSQSDIDRMVIAVAKSRGLKYRRVEVLSRNLRRSLDLYRQPYRPTRWVFVEVRQTAQL